ncbi:hypothetical protein [Falsibacillus albus]|uniref:Uncharacterized protein n=1 Tax=Falsibacillus albus TaxID=2478915 RepID=A0A3L7K3E9_9BACI|nr:hypothetical protein [Falsibacillus albus]RLQ96834.1 hypothetical protein D9X91_06965 [Falsibacillus albus]
MFHKKRTLIIAAVLFCSLITGIYYFKEKPGIIKLKEDLTLSVNHPWTQYKKVESHHKSYDGITDDQTVFMIKKWGQKIGYLSITKRTLPNKDLMVFERMRFLKNEHSFESTIKIGSNTIKRITFTDWNKKKKLLTHHEDFGEDPTSNPDGLYHLSSSNQDYEMIMGKTFTSKEMSKSYQDGHVSKLRNLVSEEKTTAAKGNAISQDFTGSQNDVVESWFMLSDKKLFKDSDIEKDWISFCLANPTKTNNWFTESGPYNKLPWSIEPFTKLGYGRNLGRFQDREALDWYNRTKERFFYNLTLNSYADLLTYREDKETVHWETEYTSTWLKKAYGTTAPYVDTRHNEYISLFLSDVSKEFQIGNSESYIQQYADYLIQQVKKGNTIPVDNGYLIRDYYSPYVKVENHTHASLNHELGGLNMLLRAYRNTNDQKYYETAMNILGAIDDLGSDWIRDNGDLWYQVNNDHEFTGGDYEQLTLIDLLNTQENLKKSGLSANATLEKLIHSKIEYLASANKALLPTVVNLMKDDEKTEAFS